MEIDFITSNTFKLGIARELLAPYGIRVRIRTIKLDELQSPEVEDVAMHKAAQAMKLAKHPFIVDDSGFYVMGLKGFPGAYLKHTIGMIGWQGVLKLLGSNTDRRAKFQAVLVFGDPKTKKTSVFHSAVPGIISRREHGRNNARMMTSRIFVPRGSKKTIAQMNQFEWAAFITCVERKRYLAFAKWLKRSYAF
ncbi:MAG TPA: non-canonical purine NTP pyrophosphatase [Candidatus Baltobacteraceae bacterium]|nr:non-canonical purine NTP pyrophosphatase [Candidatus Baltobacteraceae bacterium]